MKRSAAQMKRRRNGGVKRSLTNWSNVGAAARGGAQEAFVQGAGCVVGGVDDAAPALLATYGALMLEKAHCVLQARPPARSGPPDLTSCRSGRWTDLTARSLGSARPGVRAPRARAPTRHPGAWCACARKEPSRTRVGGGRMRDCLPPRGANSPGPVGLFAARV